MTQGCSNLKSQVLNELHVCLNLRERKKDFWCRDLREVHSFCCYCYWTQKINFNWHSRMYKPSWFCLFIIFTVLQRLVLAFGHKLPSEWHSSKKYKVDLASKLFTPELSGIFVLCLFVYCRFSQYDVFYLLIIGVEGYYSTWSHCATHTPHSVGLFWARNRPVAETSTWQHTALTTDRRPFPWQDSNSQSQEVSGRGPTP